MSSRALPTVDDLLIDTLGKWCERCQRVTQPYVGEGEPLGYGAYTDEWPCCNGCWRVYPDAAVVEK
jgi:hypothetical protein